MTATENCITLITGQVNQSYISFENADGSFYRKKLDRAEETENRSMVEIC